MTVVLDLLKLCISRLRVHERFVLQIEFLSSNLDRSLGLLVDFLAGLPDPSLPFHSQLRVDRAVFGSPVEDGVDGRRLPVPAFMLEKRASSRAYR